MPLLEPEPGLVIRYDYLWLRESDAARSSGKDRPACIVATLDDPADSRLVLISPITHSPRRGIRRGWRFPIRSREISD